MTIICNSHILIQKKHCWVNFNCPGKHCLYYNYSLYKTSHTVNVLQSYRPWCLNQLLLTFSSILKRAALMCSTISSFFFVWSKTIHLSGIPWNSLPYLTTIKIDNSTMSALSDSWKWSEMLNAIYNYIHIEISTTILILNFSCLNTFCILHNLQVPTRIEFTAKSWEKQFRFSAINSY